MYKMDRVNFIFYYFKLNHAFRCRLSSTNWLFMDNFYISCFKYITIFLYRITIKKQQIFKNIFKTILIFSLVGFLISILFVIFNFKNISIIMNDTIIWLFIITLVFGIYGSIYWLLNYIISKKIVK